MNICFVTYWGLNEGLTQATVVPHLKILLEFDQVSSIQFVSMERSDSKEWLKIPGVNHHHVQSSASSRDKLNDPSRMLRLLSKLHEEKPIDLLIARGVMAAWLSLKFVKKEDVPISIESFEPHADYMVEDGVWNKLGLRYRVLRRAENEEKKVAKKLFPVTDAYSKVLIEKEGISADKVRTMPCCVDLETFQFQQSDRDKIRGRLSLESKDIVGIYTGKLGGIYLEKEAIEIIKAARDAIGVDAFYLVILSPDQENWKKLLIAAGFNSERFHVGFVKQSEVGMYLSASDFAFSLHRPTPSKMGISPIKNGEYMANGLPIVIPKGIGDDSQIILENGFGIVVDNIDVVDQKPFEQLPKLIHEDRRSGKIAAWAKQNRSFDVVRACYSELLGS